MNITQNLTYSGAIILAAIVSRLFAAFFIKALVKRLEDNDPETTSALEQRTYTLAGLAKNITNVLIYGTAFIMVLSQWGINIAPILTGAGILGLAVGFGAQTLVKDVVTGFFILLENHYNVGDKIKIAGHTGTVVDMSIRTTVLVDQEGKTYLIPNSQIATIEKDAKNH
ncbi:mechanosensitive ion channel [bacterium]|nr:mechanosensitive ion channel [bacterium]